MNRKLLLNVLRVVVSVGLIVYVCTKIQLNDALVKTDGTRLTGRLIAGQRGPESFTLRASGGDEACIPAEEILQDANGRLIGVERGIITVVRDLNLRWFIPAFLLLGTIPLIAAMRFRWLLAVQEVHLSLQRSLALTFLGNFFNNFMLGLTGGDVVKAYAVARETHKRTEAVITVFLDRAVGLVAMVLVAAFMVALNLREPKLAGAAVYVLAGLVFAVFMALTLYSRTLRRKLYYTVFAGVIVGGGMMLLYRVWQGGWDWRTERTGVMLFAALAVVTAAVAFARPLRRLMGMHKLRNWLAGNTFVRETDAALSTFSRAPGTSIVSLAVSMVAHLVATVSIFGIARALGIDAPLRYFLVFVPVIFMITSVPITMAGWGLQEAVFQVFFGTVGVGATEALTMSFVYRLCYGVLWSLPGGAVLMMSKQHPASREVEAEVADAERNIPAQK